MLVKLMISAIFLLCYNGAAAQDSTTNKKPTTEAHQYRKLPNRPPAKMHIYRDTRLGSSSPMYNTYRKNDNGAGAITTNPNKGGGGAIPFPVADNQKDSVYKK
ncbi:MAG: hypothetical protein JSS98_00445 [Bacteroidetes bacterium]|nr:hypothetical protein [Bacteroidota bacterium]